jgi:cytochrome c556
VAELQAWSNKYERFTIPLGRVPGFSYLKTEGREMSKPSTHGLTRQLTRVAASALAVAALLAGVSAVAQQAPKPEQLIKWRQSAYQLLAWNTGRVKANVEGTYNKEDVVKAANTIAAIANTGLGSLFVPGTETGKGWHETAVKPELFTDKKAGEAAAAFNKEANELAKVAGTGDVAAVKAQLGKLQGTCKGCHDDFKKKES